MSISLSLGRVGSKRAAGPIVRRILVAGTALTLSLASMVAMASGWDAQMLIREIEIGDTGIGPATYLALDGSPVKLPGVCPGGPFAPRTDQFVLGGGANNVQAMTEAARSAFYAGRKIRPYFDGTCNSLHYATITAITLQ
jgi:hypothetical protein